MVKTDKGAKGGCTKIKNKGSSHHRQTVADREESWVRQLVEHTIWCSRISGEASLFLGSNRILGKDREESSSVSLGAGGHVTQVHSYVDLTAEVGECVDFKVGMLSR